jgi:DNA-binding protein YbaB
VDVNVMLDELVLHGDSDMEELADRIRAATEDALAPDAATQVVRAVLDAVSGDEGPRKQGPEGWPQHARPSDA